MNVRSSYEVSFKWTKPVFMFLVERSWMLVPDAGCFRLPLPLFWDQEQNLGD